MTERKGPSKDTQTGDADRDIIEEVAAEIVDDAPSAAASESDKSADEALRAETVEATDDTETAPPGAAGAAGSATDAKAPSRGFASSPGGVLLLLFGVLVIALGVIFVLRRDDAPLNNGQLAAAAQNGDVAALVTAVEQSRAEIADLRAQVEAAERRAGEARRNAGAAQTPADNGALRDQLAEVETRLADIETDSAETARQLDDAGAAREGLDARLAKLEDADLASQARRAALALALADLSHEALSGRPYAAQLDVVTKFTDAADYPELAAFAETGMPSLARLVGEFPARHAAAVRAERIHQPGGWFTRLWRNFLNLITVRRTGALEGETAEARLARADLRLRDLDLAGALDELGDLDGPAGQEMASWVRGATARRDLDEMVNRLTLQLTDELTN